MTRADANSIAVVGGGVIGVASALALQIAGQRTLLLDGNELGRGCSYGNAGVIASSFVLPLSSPRHILGAPRMLLDPLGPLAIRFRDLPTILPWLLRFIANGAPSRQRQTIESLKALNERAVSSWRELLSEIGQPSLLIERGMLDVARNPKTMRRLRAATARLRAAGIPLTELDRDEVAELEPILRERVAGGVLHQCVAHVDDPFRVTQALLTHFIAIGGAVRRDAVREIVPREGSVILRTDVDALEVARTVVCAGLGSATLLRNLALRVPIGVEHGYHLMLPAQRMMPTRPISFHAESVLATPLRDGLRLAGTVELATEDAAPNWQRADRLIQLARPYLSDLDVEGATRWHGGRPSFPDSLPAIGRVSGAPQIIYAFGHQHLGLTLAAITARCVAALAGDAEPPVSLADFSLERFSSQAASPYHSGGGI